MVQALRPEGFRTVKLDRVPTKDRGTLHTMGQAVEYMTSIGKKRELRTHWQRACKLILAKEDVMTVSRALELARQAGRVTSDGEVKAARLWTKTTCS